MRKHRAWRLTLGARPEPDGVWFRVWAPGATRVDVITFPDEKPHALEAGGDGYHSGLVPGLATGTRYMYRLDDTGLYPDPASRSQPEGVHEASEVVDPDAFRWTDAAWTGTALSDLVIYELHIGTFTPSGSFDSTLEHLDAVARLGATAIEIMPIGEFAGSRNWGYDGVGLFAPASTYGGPSAFKRLVDAAHRRGLGVILDVVYNHLGPEGNYLRAVTGSRFFTDRHGTPWGDAVNFDGADSGPVRDFVIQNALHWADEYHVDGLRLDATHAIVDESPVHILRELADALHALDRPRLVIAEDERAEPRFILPAVDGGYGLDAVWADDFHHQLRRLTAGDREGYFRRYGGTVADVVATLDNGWYRDRAPTGVERLPPCAFVHCIQNHDQVGNRAMGERLNQDIPMPVYRAISTLLLLSPYTPLLWMGQEWAATTPFQFFTNFPAELGRLVTEGRRNEFKAFAAYADPIARKRIPDPQAEQTFLGSQLRWEERSDALHRGVLALYTELLAMRRTEPALRARDRDHFAVTSLGDHALALRRSSPESGAILVVINFEGDLKLPVEDNEVTSPPAGRRWTSSLWTEDERFGGPGSEARLEPAGLLVVPSPGAVVLCSGNSEGNAR
jgi:maltooligosyltrehalose trehalohydrolase